MTSPTSFFPEAGAPAGISADAGALPAPDADPLAPTPFQPKNPYWALSPSEDIGEKLVAKVEQDSTTRLTRESRERYARAYSYYYGVSPEGVHATSQVLRGGEQGELAEVRVNHSRSLVNTLENIITASKVSWLPKATNTDTKSIAACELAAAVLEYYYVEGDVSRVAMRALEEALVFSEGFVLLEWDEDAGEPVVGLPNKLVHAGDARFRNVSTWDIIRDTAKTSWDDVQWVIVRTRRNKFDLVAKYAAESPDFEDLIHKAESTIIGRDKLGGDPSHANLGEAETDDIDVYVFYHARTPACPDGRRVVFLSNKAVLEDSTLDYEEVPLYRVAAGDLIGAPSGYTTYWDILGVQEVIDSLHTSVTSNNTTFGTQMVAMPAGSEKGPEDVGGLQIWYYPEGTKPPEGINLTKSAPETYNYIEQLTEQQRLLMGLNSVVQGETPSGELSGSALALLTAQVQQQSSKVQANWLRLLQRLGRGLLAVFRQRADLPRKTALVGANSAYVVREAEYTGQDFGKIKSVTVELGNPMAQSHAGRWEMAKELAGMMPNINPAQLMQVLTTGQLKPLTNSLQRQLANIQSENEALGRGEKVLALILDDHLLHAREHRGVLDSLDARSNPEVINAVLAHIDQHEQLYYTAPPTKLMMVGIQPPMMPMGPPPPGGPPGAGGSPPGGGPGPDGNAPPEKPSGPRGNPTAGKEPEPPAMPNTPTGERVPLPVPTGARPA